MQSMLIIIQFPITDLRPFLDLETGRLNRPSWGVTTPDEDFVRSFGHIRLRRLGGLTGWVGEGIICEANRAIRFNNLHPFIQKETNKSYQPKIIFKRFYSEGISLGKFEIGLSFKFPKKKVVSENLIKDLLLYVLQIPAVIPFGAEQINCHLVDAGKPLSKLYLLSTTEVSFINQLNNSWIKFGKPMVMVLRGGEESAKVPFFGKKIYTKSQEKTDLWYYLLPHNGKNYFVYFFGENRSDLIARPFRIYIARLYAEKECLKKVLESIRTKDVNPERQSKDASDCLQEYLSFATNAITDLESKTDSLSGKIDMYARSAMELMSPGERDEILKALKRIRPTVLHKVEKFFNQIVFQENIMGDKYTINNSQVGAVGPNASAHNTNFHQWNNLKESVDLSKLAIELSQLRGAMKQASTSLEHDTAVGVIASAEVAAKEGHRDKVFEHLAKAGQWALDVATKIGVAMAIEALKAALRI